MKIKFKKGDKVRFITKNHVFYGHVGRVIYVTSNKYGGFVNWINDSIKYNNEYLGPNCVHLSSQLELIDKPGHPLTSIFK